MLTHPFQRLALLTAALVYLLVILGGAVSAWDAGLACPDWPLCHGRTLPVMDGQVFLEWFHRLVAGLVGLLIVWTGITAWRTQRHRPGVAALGLALAGLLAVQVVLGGLTVLWLLPPLIVTLHLGVATAIVTTLLLFSLLPAEPAAIGRWRDARTRESGAERAFRRWAYLAAAATFLLMLAGAYTSKSGAGLACPDWPLCHGQAIPPFLSPQIVAHWVHRVGAALVGFVITYVAVSAWSTQRHRPRVVAAASVALLLLLAQVTLGGLAVLKLLPPALVTAHLGTATALFISLVVLSLFSLAPAPAAATAFQEVLAPSAYPGAILSDDIRSMPVTGRLKFRPFKNLGK